MRFLEVIPVGANLYPAYWKFMDWLLVDESDGVIRFGRSQKTRDVITKVAGLYERLIAGQHVSPKEWQDFLGTYAYSTVADAAIDAAADVYATDAYAADDYARDPDADIGAAYAAAHAAAAVAAAAGAAYASIAARSKARIRQSEKLLELLVASAVGSL